PGFTIEIYESIRETYNQWDFWAIFTAGFTPIPFKIFTITAGVFNINFAIFMLASAISRGARFFIIAFLIWKYGPRIKDFIDRQFNLLAIAVTLLLILGFVAIKYLI
ncbi:DedA family protein, partial [Patescibacteria group bacterium]|nr:DedA family protein [Patescibacteria group bacterium]